MPHRRCPGPRSSAAPAQQAAKATAPLFQPLKLPGGVELQHRAVMAPLTRCRAPGAVPTVSAASVECSQAMQHLLCPRASPPTQCRQP